MRKNAIRKMHHHRQQLVFGSRQVYFSTADSDAMPHRIDFNIARSENSRVGSCHETAAKNHAKPSVEFTHCKRLRHEVVSAGIQRRDLVFLASSDRQDNDWRLSVLFTNLPNNFDSVS